MLISSDLLISKTSFYSKKILLRKNGTDYIIKPLLYIFISFLIVSCASTDSTRKLIKTEDSNLYWRDLSLFLAGLPLDGIKV